MSSTNKPRSAVPAIERGKIDRMVLAWLNTFPDKPVDAITQEQYMGTDGPGMALSEDINAYINRAYITGGYEAEYQFTVVYRIKPGKSQSRSLAANELLNALGEWAAKNKPGLGDGIRVAKVEPMTLARLYAIYEGGEEDHHIQIKIIYEVK